MTQERTALLVHVRPGQHETDDSFLRRLFLANHVGPVAEASLRLGARTRVGARGVTSELLNELSDVDQARLQRPSVRQAEHSCPRCLLGMVGQNECRMCAGGACIEQWPHADRYVCERHALWVGPNTPTGSQQSVSADVVEAHARWRRMRRRGTISIATTAELQAVFLGWASATGLELNAPEIFRLSVNAWSALTKNSLLRRIGAPSLSFAAAYRRLASLILHIVGADEPTVVDGIWCLLKPIFLYRREDARGEADVENWDVHFGPAPSRGVSFVGPVQSFAGFEEQLRTCEYPRWHDFVRRCLAPLEQGVLRGETKASTGEAAFICRAGHRYTTVASALARSHASRWEGCGFCSRKRPVPGVTSLDATHPEIARHWAQDLNGSTTPRDVLFGTSDRYVWRCDAGHTYRATINSQTKAEANGCPYCTHRRAWAGETGIDPCRPDMLERWDYESNTVSPKDVLPHSSRIFRWTCARGHSYRSPAAAVAEGRGCGVCRGRQVVAGVNDLASQRPDVAREWHPTRNGKRAPSMVYVNSRAHVWWRCRKGHEWETEVAKRTVESQGCRECAFERSRVRAGVNSLADLRPELAEQWHRTLNGDLRPSDIGIGNHLVVWWRCPRGHAFPRGTAVRVRKPLCPYCANKWVLPGENDIVTRHPQLIRDWSLRNRPAVVTLPGNSRRYWFCLNGHLAFETVPNRIKTRGCPKCPESERAMNLPILSNLASAPYLEVIRRLPPDSSGEVGHHEKVVTGYPDLMTRRPRSTPAELSPEPWPDEASGDPVAEAVRQFVLRLRAEIGDRSIRSVAAMANVDQNALRRLLLGSTWPDLATLARLELALNADLWARPDKQ